MEEKGWMGAELIFDLDADHLEGADQMSFDDMLAQIKKEMISLVDNYLFGDMGFSPCSMTSSHRVWSDRRCSRSPP